MTARRDLQALGREIRRHRKARGLGQEKLAELAELSTNYIGFVERAERSASLATVFNISRALGLHPSELLRDMRWSGR
ncbi:MAG TPA: helix-turn-helix transcriptional regulator [Rhizomicrobium sp.]